MEDELWPLVNSYWFNSSKSFPDPTKCIPVYSKTKQNRQLRANFYILLSFKLVAPIWNNFFFKILWWNTYNFNLSSPPSNFPWEAISLMACSRHLTSSVGVKVKAQKNAAPLPERAFSMGVRWATSLLPRRAMMAFWHSP